MQYINFRIESTNGFFEFSSPLSFFSPSRVKNRNIISLTRNRESGIYRIDENLSRVEQHDPSEKKWKILDKSFFG